MKFFFKTLLVVFVLMVVIPFPVFAQDETLEGKILNVVKKEEISGEGQVELYRELEILVTKGSLKDKKIKVEIGKIKNLKQPKYEVGDQVLISYSHDENGQEFFYITDYIRRLPLIGLFLFFVVLVIAVGRWQGASSLLGLAVSFLVIFSFILPNILAGYDPILTSIIGALFIIPFSFYLAHGFNKKTTIAMAGTFISLVITGILASFLVEITRLTGYASEEMVFLQTYKEGTINVKGLLLAGIIIGALGILDDITIAQAAVVSQLKETNPRISSKELFMRAMNVGQDHIASMVNTLILIYTGAALPLLLLFVNTPHSFTEVINYEIISEEIVRTLVGSIGLIGAVPITTFLAIQWLRHKTPPR